MAQDPTLLSKSRALPDSGKRQIWGRLLGASAALALSELATRTEQPLLVLAEDPRHADQLEAELRYFLGGDYDIAHFVEWETLPWDGFSPHQDIISERLSVLARLRSMRKGIVVASAPVLLQKLPPTDYVAARSVALKAGENLHRDDFIDALTASGYYRVPQVSEHGEFSVRGSLIDLFPMGATTPIRIDLFDDEIETLRLFSAETQLSGEIIDSIEILPAREVPLDPDSIKAFRAAYRERFEGQPAKSRVYRDVSDGIAHGGIEYYLPLFFDNTAGLLDYIPENCLIAAPTGIGDLLSQTWADIEERYQIARLDPERPILSPAETFTSPDEVLQQASASRSDLLFDTDGGRAQKLAQPGRPACHRRSKSKRAMTMPPPHLCAF